MRWASWLISEGSRSESFGAVEWGVSYVYFLLPATPVWVLVGLLVARSHCFDLLCSEEG